MFANTESINCHPHGPACGTSIATKESGVQDTEGDIELEVLSRDNEAFLPKQNHSESQVTGRMSVS